VSLHAGERAYKRGVVLVSVYDSHEPRRPRHVGEPRREEPQGGSPGEFPYVAVYSLCAEATAKWAPYAKMAIPYTSKVLPQSAQRGSLAWSAAMRRGRHYAL